MGLRARLDLFYYIRIYVTYPDICVRQRRVAAVFIISAEVTLRRSASAQPSIVSLRGRPGACHRLKIAPETGLLNKAAGSLPEPTGKNLDSLHNFE